MRLVADHMMIAGSGAAPFPSLVDLDSERLRVLSKHPQLHRDVTSVSANQNRLSDVAGEACLLQPLEALLYLSSTRHQCAMPGDGKGGGKKLPHL